MLLTGSRYLDAKSFENMYFLYILKGKTVFQNQKMFFKGCFGHTKCGPKSCMCFIRKVKHSCSEP